MNKFFTLVLSFAFAVSVMAKGHSVAANNHAGNGQIESAKTAFAKGQVSADSLVNLALYHKAVNPEFSEPLLKAAADAGNLRAMTELGVLYAFSPNYSSKVADGVKLLEAAARGGSKEAAGYLGYYYFNKKDYGKAASYLEAARPLTLGIEYAALGSMYLEGKGVKESGKMARDNFKQSSLLGLPRGMALYASLLGTKNGGKQDYKDSFFWFYLAGELGDNYSRVMLYRPRVPEAVPDTKESRDAQSALAWIEMVHTGKSLSAEPVYKDGFLKGLKDREKMAEQGDDWSRFYLGGMNYNGDFLNQNYARALYYYEPIARNGKLPKTMLAVVHQRLADMYRSGKGTVADKAKADRHAKLAAAYGSAEAYRQVENSGK